MSFMTVDLRHLRQLAAVGEHRSFGRAARALGISQPALSKGIGVLEEALQVRVFERGARGATPTAAGRWLLSRAVPLLRGVGDLMVEAERLRGLKTGSLAVGAGMYPYELDAGRALCRVAARHPELHLRLVLGDWRTLTRDVLAGVVDLAVADVAAAEREPALHVERLVERRGTFFCRSGHPLARSARLALREVVHFPLALPPIPASVAQHFTRAKAQGRIEQVTGDFVTTLQVDSVSLMKRLVRETDAIGWAPEALLGDAVSTRAFVALDVSSPWAKLRTGIIRLRDRVSTPAEETFISELRRVEQELGGRGRVSTPHSSHSMGKTGRNRTQARFAPDVPGSVVSRSSPPVGSRSIHSRPPPPSRRRTS